MRNKIVRTGGIVFAVIALGACASKTTVQPKALAAAAEAIKDGDMATMECDALQDSRLGLAEQIAGATVKPRTVDFTDASQVSKAKDLKPPQTAASVALTAVKSTIPGAGFAPLVTGSAFRSAARNEAIGEANVKLARLEGVMLAKGCKAIVGEDEAPEEEAAMEADAASEGDAMADTVETEPAASTDDTDGAPLQMAPVGGQRKEPFR